MKKAFTLAEVLITLMIIGVVAALTIPSVIVNAQQQEFKTGLKKAVSVLNSAITMNKALEGESPYDNADLFDYLQQHMSVLKTASYNTCYNEDGGVVQNVGQEEGCYGKNHTLIGYKTNKAFYTTDGMRFEIFDPSGLRSANLKLHETGINLTDSNHKYITTSAEGNQYLQQNSYCGSYGLAENPNGTQYLPCILLVDVNGDRKPNPSMNFVTGGNQNFEYDYAKVGDKRLKDIFLILITDEKAIPFGVVAQKAMYNSK